MCLYVLMWEATKIRSLVSSLSCGIISHNAYNNFKTKSQNISNQYIL